jgi:hypothetical protein
MSGSKNPAPSDGGSAIDKARPYDLGDEYIYSENFVNLFAGKLPGREQAHRLYKAQQEFMRVKVSLNEHQKDVIQPVQRKMEFRIAEEGVQEAKAFFTQMVNPKDEEESPYITDLQHLCAVLHKTQEKIEGLTEQSKELQATTLSNVLDKMKEINENKSENLNPGTSFTENEIAEIKKLMQIQTNLAEILKLRVEKKKIRNIFQDFKAVFEYMKPDEHTDGRKILYAPGEIPELYGSLKNSAVVEAKFKYFETLENEGITDENLKKSMMVSDLSQWKPKIAKPASGTKVGAARASAVSTAVENPPATPARDPARSDKDRSKPTPKGGAKGEELLAALEAAIESDAPPIKKQRS